DNSVVELLSVQLPTGATISYTYNDLHEAQPNWPGRFPPPPYTIRKTVATRTVTVGAQSFEWSYGVNSSGVTVTNPDTSSETHVLSKIGTAPYTVPVESQVSYHDASGKVIRTVAKTWTGESGPDNALDNIRQTSEVTTLDNGLVGEVDTDYETFQYTL